MSEKMWILTGAVVLQFPDSTVRMLGPTDEVDEEAKALLGKQKLSEMAEAGTIITEEQRYVNVRGQQVERPDLPWGTPLTNAQRGAAERVHGTGWESAVAVDKMLNPDNRTVGV